MLLPFFAFLLVIGTHPQKAAPRFAIHDKQTVLFIGDSNTAAGGFVQEFETYLYAAQPKLHVRVIDLGLPSEGVTGLSEPDHPFPRPNVHDRLDRALELVKPDWVIACYGMNDGIYYPFSEGRFAAYKSGMTKLIDKVRAAKARLLVMTPPPFDVNPVKDKVLPLGATKYSWMQPYEKYDEVMERYSKWLTTLHIANVRVIDLHKTFSDYLSKSRRANPSFTVSGDGVHIDSVGHAFVARELIGALGAKVQGDSIAGLLKGDHGIELRSLIAQRERILHGAWLSYVGHKRPGVEPGLPMAEAEMKAAELDTKIRATVQPGLIK